ncbi:MAG: PE-PPE domain-containing protein [Mycobacterium sp.]|nr:PE-PPE domain-containing protein [Mycobacterium sp.]
MRGLFAVAAASSIAASSAFVSPNVNLAANVLTVTGYTSLGSLDWDMADMLQGGFCSQASGNTCDEVEYLSGVPNIGESSGLWALRAALATTAPPTMVVGFSQGAMIATEWMLEYGETAWSPSPADLSFVLMANPQRKYGGVRPVYDIEDPTPADNAYRVLDIAMEYDGAADVPDNLFNLLAVANAIAGFQHIHIDGYDDVDLDSSEKLVWIDGNTTYVLIRSQNIPLLQPLRNIGLDALADALNDPLKRIIDSAYDRDYVGLVDEDLHDDVLAEFPHASSVTPAVTAARSVAPQTLDVADAAAGDGTAATAESAPVEESAGGEIDAGESESDSAVGDIDDSEGESPEQDAESGVDLEDEDVDSLPAVDGAAVDESQGEDVALSEAEPDTEDDKKDSSAEASASETGDTSASGDTAASRDDSGSGDDSAGE